MDLLLEARALVQGLKEGLMSSTAYDTSWFVRLLEASPSRFPSTYAWVLDHQHQDGSWGGTFETFHDRIISTLSVVNALHRMGSATNIPYISKGLDYLFANADKLKDDKFETIGFELLLPTLVEEARELGLAVPDHEFNYINELKKTKLAAIPQGWMYDKETPLTHNLEYLGRSLQVDKAISLLDVNGSVGNSPSASAYLAQYVNDERLNRYLDKTIADSIDGGISNVKPFEIFEIGWVYYNLLLADLRLSEMSTGFEYLLKSWRPSGVGISKLGLMPDADDSALVMKVLTMGGYSLGLEFLQYYNSAKGYLCFPFERNPSVSTNIHILDAMDHYHSNEAKTIRMHVLDFLRNTRIEDSYWKDKWHISPYYATCHAILALRNADPELAADALDWIIDTQRDDGSWGYFAGTLEETSYCVQAIMLASHHRKQHQQELKHKALKYLLDNWENRSYPELWVGKGLYAPINVIKSSVISAIILCKRELD